MTCTLTSRLQIVEPLELTGEYTIQGKVLAFPITGTGRCNITMGAYTDRLCAEVLYFQAHIRLHSKSRFSKTKFRKIYVEH